MNRLHRTVEKTEVNTYLSVSQTIESVMHSQHGVALDDSHPDSWADRSVHPSARSADVHDGHIDVALVSERGTKKEKKIEENMLIKTIKS